MCAWCMSSAGFGFAALLLRVFITHDQDGAISVLYLFYFGPSRGVFFQTDTFLPSRFLRCNFLTCWLLSQLRVEARNPIVT